MSKPPINLVRIDFVHPLRCRGHPCKKKGIDFALLVHPFQRLLSKKQERFRVFLVLFYTRFVSKLPINLVGIDFVHPLRCRGHPCKKKKQTNLQINLSFCLLFFLRRGRDSNPRYLSVRRFSRPVQSTTLPPLLRFLLSRNVVLSFLTLQRYIKKVNCARE